MTALSFVEAFVADSDIAADIDFSRACRALFPRDLMAKVGLRVEMMAQAATPGRCRCREQKADCN